MADIDMMSLSSGIGAFEAKHFGQAMMLLSPLAEAGEVEAQYRMAIMLQNGLGMVPNPAKAHRYMQAAAEQGHALAQHGLGFMYLQGECVAQADPQQAAAWFQKAADQGLVGSMATLAGLYEQGLGVEKNPEEAQRLYQLAGF